MLSGYLGDELPRSPRIFIDDHTQTGENWVDRIGSALGSARVLLAVLTRQYFTSKWCIHELDLMHKRLQDMRATSLIFPVIACGSMEMLPEEINKLQMCDLTEFRILDIQPGTKRFERFSDKVKNLSSQIAVAINDAPSYDSSWKQACIKRFHSVYNSTSQESLDLIETLNLKCQCQQFNVPRVFL
jgi:Zn-finger domain-containing protein